MRSDLPFGTFAAQLIHAAGESSPGDLPPDTRAVALSVPDECSLLALESRLLAAGVFFCAIREPDSPYFGALVAIGVAPQSRTKKLKKLLGHLQLVK